MYVDVNSSDTTPSYLDSKIEVVAGDSSMEVTKTIQNPSGNEKISYSLKAVGAMGGGGGVKIAIDTTQHVQNTATTATVYSVPIPLNTLLTNNAIYYKVLVSSLTDSGNKNTTIAVKYGGTTFTTIVIDENTTASKGFIEGVIIANGSTSSQKAQMIATIDKGGTGTGSNWSAYGTGSVDSTVNQDLDIVCTTQSGASITFEAVIVEQISNNGNGTIQPFVLGEPVSVNDYLYESDGTPVTVTSSAYTNDYYVNSSSTFVGQVITPSDPAISQITSASFYANGVGYSGTATAQVYALSGGLPTGSALGTSSPLAYSSGELPFTFSSPVSVTPGTSYAIVLNVSGSTGIIMNVIIQSVDPGIVSTNGGSTWSAPGGNTRYSVTYATSAGKVYKVDLSNPKFGAYKGFAIQSGTAGQTKNVQIGGVLGGFTSLTSGMNVYNDPSTPGGITQTSGISAGRAVGIAVSATQIQLSQMRKRDSGISYSSGTVINQDGFLLCLPNDISGGFSVTETDPLGNAVTLLSGSNGYATGTQVPVTVPVRPGCYYNHDGTFYPLING
jgi:hypothetical protein